MSQAQPRLLLFRILHKFFAKKKTLTKNKKKFGLEKRQKFGIGVAILSLGLFLAEYAFNGYGVLIAAFLAIVSDLLLFWAIRDDLRNNFSAQVFVLPFLYSLAFGLFSFLTPARILTRIVLTTLYAIGLYSVFLSENIFTVASIRTIALLNSARIVSLVISLIGYFFLSNTIFSLRIGIIPTAILILVVSALFVMHAIWTYTLEKSLKKDFIWIGIISMCLLEIAIVLWFWPTSPTIVSLFLTCVWYVLIGLSHVWLDKRLFRNVLWEYIWVAGIAVVILISLTQWQG